ncbi:MAG: hypothetical protein WCE49_00415 [Terrimicrobiaceae bacterium]
MGAPDTFEIRERVQRLAEVLFAESLALIAVTDVFEHAIAFDEKQMLVDELDV